jgi:hypothetical protein
MMVVNNYLLTVGKKCDKIVSSKEVKTARR